MIPFNAPAYTGSELKFIELAMNSGRLSGDGEYGWHCQKWMQQQLNCQRAWLTPSGTAALEMAAILINIQPGDEVIMPSYTFVSTANAFVLRGAKVIFVDIQPETMNLDVSLIAAAITDKTRAIVPVHYAGVSCEMDALMRLANLHKLYVIEDAAHGVMAKYHQQYLGCIGHIGCFSFHETKNYTAGGEGGAILINDPLLFARAEVIREKGTDRSQFFRGQVDKYTWRDIGSSFLMSELQAAYLWGQLQHAEQINQRRLVLWQRYASSFQKLQHAGLIELSKIPAGCQHNAHMFWIKLANQAMRKALIEHSRAAGILTAFHYIPLHSSPAGLGYGRFHGQDRFTTCESERLLRLPLFYNLSDQQQQVVITAVNEFFLECP
jgi:dTDP-4-amino-4,6-dideoxygalactose transaminase